MLAKRLIHTLSVSMDAEEGMISRLKVSCHSIALTVSYAKPVPGNRFCAFFASVFTIFAHFHLGTWNRPLNAIHLRLGGRRRGEGGGGCFVPQYYKPTHFAEPHP